MYSFNTILSITLVIVVTITVRVPTILLNTAIIICMLYFISFPSLPPSFLSAPFPFFNFILMLIVVLLISCFPFLLKKKNQLAIDIKYWTWIIALTLALGPVVWLCMFAAIYTWNDYVFQYQSDYYGTFSHVFASQTFWAVFFLCLALCNLPFFLIAFFSFRFRPTPIDEVRRLVADHKPPRDSRGVVPPAPTSHELTGWVIDTKRFCDFEIC